MFGEAAILDENQQVRLANKVLPSIVEVQYIKSGVILK